MAALRNIIDAAKYKISNMSVRSRLMVLTVLGLAVTMTIWGWIQLRVLNEILIEQQDPQRPESVWRTSVGCHLPGD